MGARLQVQRSATERNRLQVQRNATERNRLQVQRNATERNRLQVQRNATDGKDSLVMDARAHPHVQRRTERTRCYKWYAHPKSGDDKGQRRTTTRQRRTTERSADDAVRSTYVCLGATSRRRRVEVKFLERMWAFSVGEGCARRRWTVGRSTCATVVTCWRGHYGAALQHVWRSCQTTVGHQPAVVIFVTWSRCRRMVNRTLSEVRGESGDRCLEECLETDVWRALTHTSRSKLSANHSV